MFYFGEAFQILEIGCRHKLKHLFSYFHLHSCVGIFVVFSIFSVMYTLKMKNIYVLGMTRKRSHHQGRKPRRGNADVAAKDQLAARLLAAALFQKEKVREIRRAPNAPSLACRVCSPDMTSSALRLYFTRGRVDQAKLQSPCTVVTIQVLLLNQSRLCS